MASSWPMLSSAGHGCWANCESGSFSPLAMIIERLACRTARPAVAPACLIDCRREPHKHLFTACPTEQPSRRPQHALRFRPQTAAAWRPLAELISCAQVSSQQDLWRLRGIAKTGPFPAKGSRIQTAQTSQGKFATQLRPLATTAGNYGPGAINRHCFFPSEQAHRVTVYHQRAEPVSGTSGIVRAARAGHVRFCPRAVPGFRASDRLVVALRAGLSVANRS